ncbi:mitochondrial inner membrane protein required for protein import [Dispira simplex]|nr:mitochondrial inner membrane protein required for protein import [Dispira simplex]
MAVYPLYTVDVFALNQEPFTGNPAAVCLLPQGDFPSNETLARIAAEMNLSETAYVQPLTENTIDSHQLTQDTPGAYLKTNRFALRWFTPTMEVKLCGHATLASAHVLFQELGHPAEELLFDTLSDTLIVTKHSAEGQPNDSMPLSSLTLSMTLPQDPLCTVYDADRCQSLVLSEAEQQKLAPATAGKLSRLVDDILDSTFTSSQLPVIHSLSLSQNLRYLLVDVQGGAQVLDKLNPNFNPGITNLGKECNVVAIVFTSQLTDNSSGTDIIQRVFCPWVGILEDPVTGSSYTVAGPYWYHRKGLTQFSACQGGPRKGKVGVMVNDPQLNPFVQVIGEGVTVVSARLAATRWASSPAVRPIRYLRFTGVLGRSCRFYSHRQKPQAGESSNGDQRETNVNQPDSKNLAEKSEKPRSIYDFDPLLRGTRELNKEQADSEAATSKESHAQDGETAKEGDKPGEPQAELRVGRANRRQQRRNRPHPPDAALDQNKSWGKIILGMGSLVLMGGLFYLGQPFGDSEAEAYVKAHSEGKDKASAPSTSSPGDYWKRAKFRMMQYKNYFSKPAWDYLLPEPLPPQYQRPYTLLINLDETLIHSTWDIDHGWRTAKRPGVDYFLGYMSKFFEIVLFTTQPSYSAIPIIEKLDPYGYIMYHLFRESTRYEEGKYVKDISKLNRDLSKVVAVDSNPNAYAHQPQNTLVLQPWKGDPDDDYLSQLIPFLEYLAMSDVADVRPVLKFYRGKDVAHEFNQWEATLKEQLRVQWEKEKEKQQHGLAGWLAKATHGDQEQLPMPMFEQQRLAVRKAFEEEQESVKAHAEAERQRFMEEQQQQLKDMKLTLWKLLTEGVPKPNDLANQSQQPTPSPKDSQ